MTAACCSCRYWEFISKWQHDSSRGECRRHAPVPAQLILFRTGQLIGQIAWAAETEANIEQQEDCDYELGGVDTREIHEWPITFGFDWCGDYAVRRGPVDVKKRHPAKHARFEAEEKWEKKMGLDEKPQRELSVNKTAKNRDQNGS